MIRQVFKILHLVNTGIIGRNSYHAEHEQIKKIALELVFEVNQFFSESGRSQLAFGFQPGELFFSGQSISLLPTELTELVSFVHRLHCDGFILQKNILPKDFENLFDVGALRSMPSKTAEQAAALLTRYGISNIRPYTNLKKKEGRRENLVRLSVEDFLADPAASQRDDNLKKIVEISHAAHQRGAEHNNIELDQVRGAGELLLRLVQKEYAPLIQRLQYSEFDKYKIAHSIRMSALAIFSGLQMNWPERELLALASAGLLHDIGTSQIADNILLKKSSFSQEERNLIQRHPNFGGQILIEHRNIALLELAGCWGHHTRHDGGGYPEKPSWFVRSAATSLLQICDVFEALTAVRPHRPLLDSEAAYRMMIADRGAFHPGLLASFIGLLGLYPPGTVLQLSDGREGSVLRNSAIIDRPVLLITSHSGQSLGADDEYELDLSNSNLEWLKVAG